MKSLSLTKKFMMLLIPLFLMGGIVSFITWKALSHGAEEFANAGRLNDFARDSKFNVMEMSDAMKGFILNPKNRGEFDRKKAADERNAKSIEAMKSLTKDQESLKLIAELGTFDEKHLDPAEDEVMKRVEEGKAEEAQAYYAQKYQPLRVLYMELHTALTKRVAAEVLYETQVLEAQGKNSAILIISSLVLGLLLVAGLMFWTVSRLGRDLTVLVERMRDGSGVVAEASASISETGEDLSKSATSQAAALQETVASVEEVSAMVSRNAENAKLSLTVSASSQDAATRGKRVVEEMISAIGAISESNAEIVGRIETSNREISEIVQVISEIGTKTKVINDIVFQTKLLSFNASVEAARAGEHGKGFAVVAEEVGSLATMSGTAAKEISDMLGESIAKVERIVENTRSKVSGLIQVGKEKVENGNVVAQKCGGVLDEIVHNVDELKRMVEEIATASSEQAQGVQEINKAMGQLDEVTNQNAASSRRSAVASQKLSDQADDLKGLVAGLAAVIRGGHVSIPSVSQPSSPSHDEVESESFSRAA